MVPPDAPSPVLATSSLDDGVESRRHPIRWVVVSVGLAVLLGMGLVLGGRLGRDATVVRTPLLGKPVPEFDLASLAGGRVRSSELVGRPFVVNCWASWCVPCRSEAPALEAFWQASQDRGVGMVGIVYNDSPSAAQEFRARFGLSFPQVMDPEGRVALDFGVFGVPETFVVDERGMIMAKLVGAVAPGTLEGVLDRILAGQTFTARNDAYRTTP